MGRSVINNIVNRLFHYLPLYRVFIIVIGVALVFPVLKMSEIADYENQPYVTGGVINLNGWNLEKQGPIKLKGQWEFYWMQLLEPEDFKNGKKISKPLFIDIPSPWHKYEIDDKKLGTKGHATFRLTIKGSNNKYLALRIPEISSAVRIYINGGRIYEYGKVGTNAKQTIHNAKYDEIYFESDSNDIELVVNVSNYINTMPGIKQHVLFGTQSQVNGISKRKVSVDVFLFGALIILAVYLLYITILRRREPAVFFLSISGIMIALKALFGGNDIISYIYPRLAYTTKTRLTFTLFFLAVLFFLFYSEKVLSNLCKKSIWNLSKGITVIYILAVHILPLDLLLFIAASAAILITVFSLYYIAILLLAMKQSKDGNAPIVLLGFLALSLSIFASYYYFFKAGSFIDTLSYGSLVFIFTQAFLLSKNFTDSFKSIEEMSGRLKKIDIMNDEFLLSISRKLQQPLEKMINIIESMLEGSKIRINDFYRLNLSMLSVSTRRLHSLVSDFVDFTRLKNHDLKLAIEPVDLKQTVEMSVEISRTLFPDKNIQLINNVPDAISKVMADEKRLLQILNNLLSNSLKYTQTGKISVNAADKGNLVEITVADTGMGMTDDKINKILNAVDQIESATYKSESVGVSLTQYLIRLHGGEMIIDSHVNEGTRITFTLPRAVKGIKRKVKSKVPFKGMIMEPLKLLKELKNTLNPKGIFNVIIAGNEVEHIQPLANYLSSKNYGVVLTENGEELLLKIFSKERGNTDLVIIDSKLPGISGFEACRNIRNRYSLHELPVLLLTEDRGTETVVAALKSGANDYLTKPFNKNEMFARVETLLSIKHSAELSITNARKLESERNQRLFVETLGEVSRTLASTLDLDEVLNRLLLNLKRYVSYECGIVFIKQDSSYKSVSMLSCDEGKEKEIELSANQNSIIRKIEETYKPVLTDSMHYTDGDIGICASICKKIKSMVAAPIINLNQILGIIVLGGSSQDSFNQSNIEIVSNFATQSGIAIKNAKLFSEVKKMAVTDGLTGLYNRRYFFELAEKEFERYKRYGNDITAMMFDLDDFKFLNDTYGHHVGDEVLRIVSQKCKDIVRQNDITGRYGGEEFAVLLVETGALDAYAVAERFRKSIAVRPVKIDNGKEVSITVSIGLSSVNDNVRDIDHLMQRADKALYKAKNSGKNCIRIYERDVI